MAVVWTPGATLGDYFEAGNSALMMVDAAGAVRGIDPYATANGLTGAQDVTPGDPDYPHFMYNESCIVREGVGESGENALAGITDNDSPWGCFWGMMGAAPPEDAGDYLDFGTDRILRFTSRIRLWDHYIEFGWGDNGNGDLLHLYGKNGSNATGLFSNGDLRVYYYEFGGDIYIAAECRKWVPGTTSTLFSGGFARFDTLFCTLAEWTSTHHGRWCDFEVKFQRCTVNDWTTDDVESDGILEVWLDGVKVGEITNEPLALTKGTSSTDPDNLEAIAFGLGENFILGAWYTTPTLHDDWEDAATYDRNLVTGYGHTVIGTDNKVSGRSNTVTGNKNLVHGENVTVTGDLNAVFNLDAVARSLAIDGQFVINGTVFSPAATIPYAAADSDRVRVSDAAAVVARLQPADSIGVRLTETADISATTP